MSGALFILNLSCLITLSLFIGLLGVSSYVEKERRAVWISLGLFLFNLLFWAHFFFRTDPVSQVLNVALLAGLGIFTVLSLARFFPDPLEKRDMAEATLYDERDNMFARNNLAKHPELLEAYHRMRPENRSTDQQIHKKPDFGSPEQFFHDDHTTAVYLSAFEYLESTIPCSDGPPNEIKQPVDPESMTRTIMETVAFYGGCDTGIIDLEPYHFYSHRGRHARAWGEQTDRDYHSAIVIIVPMRVEMLKQAPTACVIQESAQKYVEAAKISNIVAGYLRSFGYRARAHNDANYDTLCVPLAVESGLGELGRMGIFMHKVHGPCVRIAVVTTDLALPPTESDRDPSMDAFCRICKKCADNCPSGSITHDEEQVSRGFRHWSIDQEKCFSYWKTVGSDCGMCIGVCPYTKPDTLLHKLVRWYISRNTLNQKIALFMDDLLYGRRMNIPKTNPDSIFNP
ncbi:MAG: 4Fe-4S dicluster domain-containing protein [Desulfobacteraceae bacterium]|nr:MAG: 4Fe-4S dicluster domain-containing protein [Desulfobacteraceae bacterium]